MLRRGISSRATTISVVPRAAPRELPRASHRRATAQKLSAGPTRGIPQASWRDRQSGFDVEQRNSIKCQKIENPCSLPGARPPSSARPGTPDSRPSRPCTARKASGRHCRLKPLRRRSGRRVRRGGRPGHRLSARQLVLGPQFCATAVLVSRNLLNASALCVSDGETELRFWAPLFGRVAIPPRGLDIALLHTVASVVHFPPGLGQSAPHRPPAINRRTTAQYFPGASLNSCSGPGGSSTRHIGGTPAECRMTAAPPHTMH